MTLRVEALTGGYGSRAVVRDVDLTVHAGKVVCLLGPNGVGKTTLFKTMLALQPALSGRVLVADRDLAALSRPEIARLIGYVPQSQQTPFAFTALDVVLMGRTARLPRFGAPGRTDRDAALSALDALGVTRLAGRRFTSLSGGERQMVMIARALAQEPAFIMLDEPTASLDFGNQVRVLDQVVRLAEAGIGVVMTTHAPDHAFLCDAEVVLLTGPSRMQRGPARDVLTSERLSDAYGVDVRVVPSPHDRRISYCYPLLPTMAARPDPEGTP
ncbi:ABC transporter ATP-binding protein [Microbacterium sp. No. 7]|uniref:ABC transporter ATP-binding protein n=1 Tax=Microbacterium sp. No. 7 TaxID=1714373 RepID=UPI0006D0ABC2|nr:ABC transporter ATP-binding protein [Microbacterium sp. No. 7]